MADIVYPPVIRTALLAFRVMGLHFDIAGTEHIPMRGGAVLASNHVSYLDFIFVGVPPWEHRRLVRFMAKDAVFHHRIAGPLMRGMHHIPVDRTAGAASYKAAVDSLASGELVGVFPEATISESYWPKEFKTGAARMAAEAGVPLVPMATFGGQRIFTKGRKRDLTRGRSIVIRIGEPIEVKPTDDPYDVTLRLKRAVEACVENAVSAYPQTDEADQWWLPRR